MWEFHGDLQISLWILIQVKLEDFSHVSHENYIEHRVSLIVSSFSHRNSPDNRFSCQ